MRKDEVARNVRVKFVEGYEPKSLADRQLMELEHFIFIPRQEIFTDRNGDYVSIYGASHTNSSFVYLKDLELEFPIDYSYRGKLKNTTV